MAPKRSRISPNILPDDLYLEAEFRPIPKAGKMHERRACIHCGGKWIQNPTRQKQHLMFCAAFKEVLHTRERLGQIWAIPEDEKRRFQLQVVRTILFGGVVRVCCAVPHLRAHVRGPTVYQVPPWGPPCIMYIELVSRSHMRASRLPRQEALPLITSINLRCRT